MNISGINFESVVDGEGVRVVIFVSGCLHNCKGCHNPTSHNFDNGRKLDDALQNEVIDYIKQTPYISGLTLSGGDPMYSAEEIISFVETIKNDIESSTVWVYSGFKYEDILKDSKMLSLLKICDVLVDGEFILEQRDTTLPYKGSRNQRIIDIQKSMKENDIILWNGEVED